MDDSIPMTRPAKHSFLAFQVKVPLPLFILKITLMISLAALSTVLLVKSTKTSYQIETLKEKIEWKRPPLILVPGLTDSKLYVEGSGIVYPHEAKYANCSTYIPLRKSWLSDQFFNDMDCEFYLLSLIYRNGKFRNRPNVSVGANLPGVPFGSSLWPVQCLYTDEKPPLCMLSTFSGSPDSYFRRLGQFLVSELDYQVGTTLFAAPYDWRHHQQSDVMNSYYENLRLLIENAVNTTGRKAVLLAHSMGNIVLNRFLRNKMTPKWQKTYLEATINVAAPYGGAMGTVRALISGITISFPNNKTIPARASAEFTRQMGFPANLLPFPNAFGKRKLLKVGNQKFTAAKIEELLTLLNLRHLIPFYAENQPQPQAHVPMHCVYSIGRNNTEVLLEYASLDDPKPKATLGDGDGIVNAESLRVCVQWKAQGHPVSIKRFDRFNHSTILMQKEFNEYVADLLATF